MNLQDIINEAAAHPERYGTVRFFDSQGNPVCPLAHHVLLRPETEEEIERSSLCILRAAWLLDVPQELIIAFLNWWDNTNPEEGRTVLEEAGYEVPSLRREF